MAPKIYINGKLFDKAAAKGSDTAALRKAMDDFNESLQKVGQHIYGAAGAENSGAEAGSGAAQSDGESGEGEVVDAEYKEV